jgi:hypothetical protein
MRNSRTLARTILATLMLAMLVVLAIPAHVGAHPLAPVLLQLHEEEGGVVHVTWRQSPMKMPGTEDKTPTVPPECKATTATAIVENAESRTSVWTMNCGPAGLVGRRVGIQGLGEAGTDGMIRVRLSDGRTVRSVVSEHNPYLIVPARESRIDVAWGYASMGFEHILGGFDHLLFVFGLLLLVPAFRPLVATVTSFTIGHSVTLSLAVLGWANLSPSVVEPVIALTVYLLAVEVARGSGRGPSLLGRFPWAMAMFFGLLHGLGFAGALREVGLPLDEIPLSLFAFNVGIEIGQVAFLSVLLAIGFVFARGLREIPAWTRTVAVYAMGSVSAFWVIERTMGALTR